MQIQILEVYFSYTVTSLFVLLMFLRTMLSTTLFALSLLPPLFVEILLLQKFKIKQIYYVYFTQLFGTPFSPLASTSFHIYVFALKLTQEN